MELERALQILGLSKNFTERELKLAYYKLTKENHPDVHGKDTEENQKEINYAHEVARNYLRSRSTEQNSAQEKDSDMHKKEEFNLEKYTRDKISILTKIIDFPNYESLVESEKVKDVIFELNQYQILFVMEFRNINSKESVDDAYQKCLKSIHLEFKRMIKVFCEEYDISEEIIKEKINISCDLNYLYKQLLALKEKYSQLEEIKNRLNQEVTKYSNYPRLKLYINDYLNQTINIIRKNSYKNYEKDIENMHNQINIIIKNYEKIEQKIQEIDTIIETIKDEKISKIFRNIKINWNENTNIKQTENSLNELEVLIEKLLEEEQFYKKVGPIYEMLIERKSKALKEKNVIKDYLKIKKINNLFDTILELLKKGYEDRKDIDFFQLFGRIYFDADETEEKIIKEIQYKTRHIYIKKRDFCEETIDSKSFFWLIDNEHNDSELSIYRIDPTNVTEQTISKQELEEEYIALDELLTSKNIVGIYKKSHRTGEKILVIAEDDDFILVKGRNQYLINRNVYTDLINNYGEEKLDKEIIIEIITKYLKERIEISKNKKRK